MIELGDNDMGERGERCLAARDRFDRRCCLYDLLAKPAGLVTVLRRSPISLCHLCFERQRADATQI